MRKIKLQITENSQVIPLALTFIIFSLLIAIFWCVIYFLNIISPTNPISLRINFADVVIGFTIYLKTAIDFAIFIGRLMQKNTSMRSRIAIELGTAVGNAFGTILIVALWVFVKEVPILLALMIFVASLVLLDLGESGMEHLEGFSTNKYISKLVSFLHSFFYWTKTAYDPILRKILPDFSEKLNNVTSLTFKSLLIFSATIPFILGLDDFAGYVSLFNTVNIFGFGIGVFAGHLVLNIGLFAFPNKTIELVKNKWVSLVGTLAFIILAIWGLYEVLHLLLQIFSVKI